MGTALDDPHLNDAGLRSFGVDDPDVGLVHPFDHPRGDPNKEEIFPTCDRSDPYRIASFKHYVLRLELSQVIFAVVLIME